MKFDCLHCCAELMHEETEGDYDYEVLYKPYVENVDIRKKSNTVTTGIVLIPVVSH